MAKTKRFYYYRVHYSDRVHQIHAVYVRSESKKDARNDVLSQYPAYDVTYILKITKETYDKHKK